MFSDSLSDSSGLFDYTINNNTGSELEYDIVNDIIHAIDKWNKVVDIPYILSEKYPSFNYKMELNINIEYSDDNYLGYAVLDRYYNINGGVFGGQFPSKGTFKINSKYLNSQSLLKTFKNGNRKLYYTTLHEIGHILGIGPFWKMDDAPINDDEPDNSYYIGTHALREYRNYFSNNELVGIPIEDDGGQGTADVHPEETNDRHSVNARMINGVYHPGLDHELMTGWSETYVSTPLSKITIGFLEDIGYKVDYNEAEEYDPNNPEL